MTDLSGILVKLLQVDETVRELSNGGDVKSEPLQRGLEGVGARLGQIAAELERYIHAETTHRADRSATRELCK